MLRAFCTIRALLEESEFQTSPRRIRGRLLVEAGHLSFLAPLQENGHLEQVLRAGQNQSHLPDTVGQTVVITLNPQSLHYYENIQDLVSYTAEEPKVYYVHGVGEIVAEGEGGESRDAVIISYRQMLRARRLLRTTADFETPGKAIFLTPEKIEIPLVYTEPVIPELRHLAELQAQFEKRPEKDPADFDQRLVLFRKSLREYLKAHPPEDRFKIFLKNFETIYDSYNRDYQLWIGNTFGELEKSFEEKRLKFVADLNGILSGVQASLLAVPIAALLLCDKFDLANPIKDFLLAVGVLTVGVIAIRLLENQAATLDATREAIDATREDFERKHNKRRQEFKTRLLNLDTQEQRVRRLLSYIRSTIIFIILASFVGWIVALNQPASPAKAANGLPTATAITNSTSPANSQTRP